MFCMGTRLEVVLLEVIMHYLVPTSGMYIAYHTSVLHCIKFVAFEVSSAKMRLKEHA